LPARLPARDASCPGPDLVIASTPPLTVAHAALSLSRRYRVPLILEVRELWPDAVIKRGTLRNKALIKLTRRLEQQAYHQASLIIALNTSIANTIKESTVDHDKISILPGRVGGEELFQQLAKLVNNA
jgi:hypothetical protein